VTELRDCTDPQAWAQHITEAVTAVREGELIVLPTDTVYGVGADAFTPEAVQALLTAKGRDRSKPPPVLIAQQETMEALATQISDDARALAENFWPGPLTLILTAQPSLMWDLGETHGTVALRVPEDEFAQELLSQTGPLAVSSANVTGNPPATDCQQALDQFGDLVAIYLDTGGAKGQVPSTIVDCTGSEPVIVRQGALTLAEIQHISPTARLVDDDAATQSDSDDEASP